jgi:hypothetical protein
LIFRIHAQDQNRTLAVGLLQRFQRLESPSAWQADVQDDHVPFLLPGEIEDLLGGLGFARYLHIAFVGHDLPQAPPHNSVIVGHQDPDHGWAPAGSP